jgi:soluble lytic murein transglycosylase-like protein
MALSASVLIALAAALLPPGAPQALSSVDALPSVDAPPPAFEPLDSDAARALDFLRDRHTGLASSELPALAELIAAEAREHHLELELVLAVIRIESHGYNFAVSPVGALGLMQLMPATGRELAGQEGIPWNGDDTLFDPSVNVRLGIGYLEHLATRYGDVETALAAYNWGPGRIDRKIRAGVGVPRRYTDSVMRIYVEARKS